MIAEKAAWATTPLFECMMNCAERFTIPYDLLCGVYKKIYLFVMQSSYSYVIARRAKAERPTWQSPGTTLENAEQYDRLYQEIATSLCSSQ